MNDKTLYKAKAVHILKNKGDSNEGHTFPIDHQHLLISGSIKFDHDGYDSVEYTAPAIINGKANKFHKFTALTDNVIVFCAFPTVRD